MSSRPAHTIPQQPLLRTATSADGVFLRALYRSTRDAELAALPWDEAQKAAFCEMQFRAQVAGYGHAFPEAVDSIVCAGDGEAAGRLMVEWTAEGLRVIDIALLPTHRGRGWGGHVLSMQQHEAATRGAALRLSVAKTNPAIRLYRRLGFVIVGEQAFHYQMTWTSREKNHGRSVSR